MRVRAPLTTISLAMGCAAFSVTLTILPFSLAVEKFEISDTFLV